MGLEDVGVIYLSRSGKGLMVKINNEKVCRFTIYLTAYAGEVLSVLEGKKAEAKLKLIVNTHNE